MIDLELASEKRKRMFASCENEEQKKVAARYAALYRKATQKHYDKSVRGDVVLSLAVSLVISIILTLFGCAVVSNIIKW